jgi:hypothetical protein
MWDSTSTQSSSGNQQSFGWYKVFLSCVTFSFFVLQLGHSTLFFFNLLWLSIYKTDLLENSVPFINILLWLHFALFSILECSFFTILHMESAIHGLIYFWQYWGFELRASHYTTWAMPPLLLAFSFSFQRESHMFAWFILRPQSSYFASWIARIIGMCHHVWPLFLYLILICFNDF